MLLRPPAGLAEGCISDLVFDAWHAGELSAGRDRELAQHLSVCDACAARARDLRAEAQGYLSRADYAPQVARISAELARRRSSRWPLLASVASAALLLLVFFRAPAAPEVRRKGSDSVGFYVRRGQALFRGHSGQRVRPRDQLRFTWRSDQSAYLVILSIDAKRVVSTYYPAQGAQRRLLPSGAEIELPNAVELDDTLGPEQVFVVSCADAPELASLRRTLAETGHLSPPLGCQVARILLFKEPPS